MPDDSAPFAVAFAESVTYDIDDAHVDHHAESGTHNFTDPKCHLCANDLTPCTVCLAHADDDPSATTEY